jgi:hypothetical protein
VSKREINLYLNPANMEALGVTAEQVVAAVRNENQDLPVGAIRSLEQERMVQISSRMQRPEDFGRIIVARKNGTPIRLSQVATVKDGALDVATLEALCVSEAKAEMDYLSSVGGPRVAGAEPGLHARRGFQHLGRGQGVAHHLGHIDVGHGESAADQETIGQRGIQRFHRHAQRRDRLTHLRLAALFGRKLRAVVEDLDGVGLDRGGAEQRPLREEPLLRHARGGKRAAEFARDVEVDGERFGQHQVAILHGRKKKRR